MHIYKNKITKVINLNTLQPKLGKNWKINFFAIFSIFFSFKSFSSRTLSPTALFKVSLKSHKTNFGTGSFENGPLRLYGPRNQALHFIFGSNLLWHKASEPYCTEIRGGKYRIIPPWGWGTLQTECRYFLYSLTQVKVQTQANFEKWWSFSHSHKHRNKNLAGQSSA